MLIMLLLCRINQRNEQRKTKAAQSKQAEKLGYVPRNKQAATLTASGLSSGGMTNRGKTADDQKLDAESAAGLAKIKDTDAEIDAGIDAISRTIDNLNSIAGSMKDEVRDMLDSYLGSLYFNMWGFHLLDIGTKRQTRKNRKQYAKDNRKANGGKCTSTLLVEVIEVQQKIRKWVLISSSAFLLL
jgi:hypothetical protein